MDNKSGELTEEDEVAGVGRDGSELEWLVRDCRREAGSWFQSHMRLCSMWRCSKSHADVGSFQSIFEGRRVLGESTQEVCGSTVSGRENWMNYLLLQTSIVVRFLIIAYFSNKGYNSVHRSQQPVAFLTIFVIMYAIICIFAFLTLRTLWTLFFIIKFIKFKPTIKFKKFEFHNYAVYHWN